MRITYHGHSAFSLETDDRHLLIDPWIAENPLCERDLGTFDDVDAVLVTHAAFDHLGDAEAIARRTGADILCDYATHTLLTERGFPEDRIHGYVWGAVHEGDGWEAKVVEARHLSMVPDEGLTAIPLAYIVSIGDERIYHMGDTSIFRDIELFGDLYEPTVGLVPVGRAEGYFTELHPDEAALAVDWLDVDLAIPMHYAPESRNPREFLDACDARGLETTDAVHLAPGTSIEP